MGKQFTTYGILALIVTFIAYYGVIGLTNLDRYIAGNIAISIATFMLYGLDKGQAKMFQKQARQRVPEKLLHLLAILGGYFGGWAGMLIFWHKVRKPMFWGVLAASTVLHLWLWFMFI